AFITHPQGMTAKGLGDDFRQRSSQAGADLSAGAGRKRRIAVRVARDTRKAGVRKSIAADTQSGKIEASASRIHQTEGMPHNAEARIQHHARRELMHVVDAAAAR